MYFAGVSVRLKVSGDSRCELFRVRLFGDLGETSDPLIAKNYSYVQFR